MNPENLFAYTEPGGSLPGYISINKRDGRFFIAVRARGQNYAQEIEVTPELLEHMACTLMDKLDPAPTIVCANCDEPAPGCGGLFATDGKVCQFHGLNPIPSQEV